MPWNNSTIIAQIILTFYFAVTHWIPLPPWNNLAKEPFKNERKINLIMHVFQAVSIIGFYYHTYWMMIIGLVFWSLWMVGHINSWWLPYFFGFPKVFSENAVEQNKETLQILPPIKDHLIPDACHIVLGVISVIVTITVWAAFFQP